jgi:hypothetical protein
LFGDIHYFISGLYGHWNMYAQDDGLTMHVLNEAAQPIL